MSVRLSILHPNENVGNITSEFIHKKRNLTLHIGYSK